MHITVKCPYCGNNNTIPLSPGYHFSKIVTCDIDDSDGCDADFVVKIYAKHHADIFKLVEENITATP